MLSQAARLLTREEPRGGLMLSRMLHLIGDGDVVEISEPILQLAERRAQRLRAFGARLSGKEGAEELGRVAQLLHRDADLVARRRLERVEMLRAPANAFPPAAQLLRGEVFDPLLRTRGRILAREPPPLLEPCRGRQRDAIEPPRAHGLARLLIGGLPALLVGGGESGEILGVRTPLAGRRDRLLDEDVEIAGLAEPRREPAQVAPHRIAALVGGHRLEDRNRGPQAPDGDAHLVHGLGIARLPQHGFVGEEVLQAGKADDLEAPPCARPRLERWQFRLDGLLGSPSRAPGELELGFAPLVRAAAGRPVRHPTPKLRVRIPESSQIALSQTSAGANVASSPVRGSAPAPRGPARSGSSARASWCRACSATGRSRTASRSSPRPIRCPCASAARRNYSLARLRCAGRRRRAGWDPHGCRLR